MRRLATRLILAALAGSWLCGACGARTAAAQDTAQDTAQDSAQGWEQAYARVDGVAILRTAVDAEAARGAPKAQVLQRFLTIEVLRGGLRRAGRDPASVGAAELDAAVLEAKTALESGGKDLDEVLKLSGQSLAEFREDLRVPLAFRALIRAGIKDEDVRAAYEAKKYLLDGEARLSHILVAVKEGRSRTQARALAQGLLRELGEGSTLEAFARLATERSDEPMASLTGGDLDWMKAGERRRDVEPGLLAQALARGQRGLLPQPVDGRRGVHLVYVSELRLTKSAGFPQHAERVRAELEREQAQRRLVDWREAAKVEYAPDAPGR